ncbi:MAG: hypothetical protein J7J80_00325 [Thermotogae bacterium]|nr:hypothetical protein [Thermotogota bacterium]
MRAFSICFTSGLRLCRQTALVYSSINIWLNHFSVGLFGRSEEVWALSYISLKTLEKIVERKSTLAEVRL